MFGSAAEGHDDWVGARYQTGRLHIQRLPIMTKWEKMFLFPFGERLWIASSPFMRVREIDRCPCEYAQRRCSYKWKLEILEHSHLQNECALQ